MTKRYKLTLGQACALIDCASTSSIACIRLDQAKAMLEAEKNGGTLIVEMTGRFCRMNDVCKLYVGRAREWLERHGIEEEK